MCVSIHLNRRTFGQKDCPMGAHGRYVNAQAFSWFLKTPVHVQNGLIDITSCLSVRDLTKIQTKKIHFSWGTVASYSNVKLGHKNTTSRFLLDIYAKWLHPEKLFQVSMLPYASMPACLPVWLSVSLSVCLSVCLSVGLPVCLTGKSLAKKFTWYKLYTQKHFSSK